MATRVMRQLIERFSRGDVFGRENYEYYARVTGRILRVADEWICSFRYPPPPQHPNEQQQYASKCFIWNITRIYNLKLNTYNTCIVGQLSLEAEKTWLQCECTRWGNKYKLDGMLDFHLVMIQ